MTRSLETVLVFSTILLFLACGKKNSSLNAATGLPPTNQAHVPVRDRPSEAEPPPTIDEVQFHRDKEKMESAEVKLATIGLKFVQIDIQVVEQDSASVTGSKRIWRWDRSYWDRFSATTPVAISEAIPLLNAYEQTTQSFLHIYSRTILVKRTDGSLERHHPIDGALKTVLTDKVSLVRETSEGAARNSNQVLEPPQAPTEPTEPPSSPPTTRPAPVPPKAKPKPMPQPTPQPTQRPQKPDPKTEPLPIPQPAPNDPAKPEGPKTGGPARRPNPPSTPFPEVKIPRRPEPPTPIQDRVEEDAEVDTETETNTDPIDSDLAASA